MDKKIRGITIEIGGDTSELYKSLRESNGEIRSAQQELLEVEKLLKDNADDTELQRQKQELLTKSLEETKKKLQVLKQTNEQVTQSAEKYEEWKSKYSSVRNEIAETKKRLDELKAAQKQMNESGDTKTDAYKNLQSEIKETKKRLADLKTEAKAVNDEFGHPVTPKQYNAFQREIIRTESDLKKLENQLNNTAEEEKESGEATSTLKEQMEKLENQFNHTAEEAKESGKSTSTLKEKLTGICDVVKSEAIQKIGDQISKIGSAANEAGSYLWGLSEEYTQATQKAAAYFGETGDAAKETAGVVEDVWLSGVGENMGQVADAVIAVKKNLADLDAQSMSNITQQVMTLDELYGIDMSETLRGVNSLMAQFGVDAQTAMDYIVAGTQNGLDKTNELGDNLAEYAGKFSQAGYSIQEYFQLLNNGLDGGAYNLDKVNDAINEVTTRLTDGTIADAIGDYSEETQMLFEEWKSGNTSQKAVIESIVKDISSVKNEQVALNLAATAFGTMGEDFSRGFVQSLSVVGTAYDDVTGKAQGMYEQTLSPQQEMEAQLRSLQQDLIPIAQQLTQLAMDIVPKVTEKVSSLLQFLADHPGITKTAVAIGALLGVLGTLIPIITSVASVVTLLGSGALLPVAGVIAAVAAGITTLIAIIANWNSIMELAEKICTAFKEGIAIAFETIGKAADSVSKTVSDGFQKVVDFFGSLPQRALEWGKDFIQGFINGIKQMIGGVTDAAKGVADKIASYLHFSRPDEGPLRDYEKWMPDMMKGLEDGIRSNTPRVQNAATIASRGIAETVESSTSKTGEKAKKTVKKTLEEIASETLSAAQQRLKNHKVYNDMTLREEMEFWDGVRAQIAEGTQARVDADAAYLEAKKNLNEKAQTAEETYTKNVAKAYEDLNDKIQSLTSQYQSAVDSRADEIKNAFGLFDEFSSETDLTSDDLLERLQGQVDGLKDWERNLDDLKGRVGDDLLAELQDLGPQSAAQIELLTQMTDDELDEYTDLFRQKNRIARRQAVDELQPMRDEISEQIRALKDETAKELAGYQEEYAQAITELGLTWNQPVETFKLIMAQNAVEMVAKFAQTVQEQSETTENAERFQAIASSILGATGTLPEEMQGIGENTIAGIIAGMESKEEQLYSVAQRIAEGITKTIASAFEIHSPSAVMREHIGKNLMLGLQEGIEKYRSIITAPTQILEGFRMERAQIASSRSTQTGAGVTDLIALLQSYLPEIAAQKTLLIDGKALVGQTVNDMDRRLAGSQKLRERIG